MRTMTCKQLGGACDLEFHADTFDEIGALSKNHGMDMHKAKDETYSNLPGCCQYDREDKTVEDHSGHQH
jgi:hypothetical protein